MQTGFEMDGISRDDPLPKTCSRKEAMHQDAKKESILDHEEIVEEAERRDLLEYDNEYDEHDDESENDVESDSE